MDATDLEALRQLAVRVTECYDDLDGLRMALLTGSVARGAADGASDLDVYLYWEQVDREALAATARAETLGAHRRFGVDQASGYFEKYDLGGRFVDVASVSMAVPDVAAAVLGGEGQATDEVLALAGAFHEAVALRGGDELAAWRRRLTYTDDLAREQVSARGVRLLAPSALYRITADRGDLLAYEARTAAVLVDAVGLLGAANRTFLPLSPIKWWPWHLDRLAYRPGDVLSRIEAGLTRPDAVTTADLDRLLLEILDLVDQHVPDADTRPARFVLALRPAADSAERSPGS
jgi:hypothetical protein